MMKFTADMIDQRNRTHRLLLIATEQALSGKAIIACGTVMKGIDHARNDRDKQAGLMVLGFLADVIGLPGMPEALNCWRQAAPYFSNFRWHSDLIRERLQEQLGTHATCFLSLIHAGKSHSATQCLGAD